MSNWIYPFKGRNRSLAIDQNFLWNQGNIYIMDNHRAALWCWLRHIKESGTYSLFHIDAHYDTAAILEDDIHKLPDLSLISFEDYLSISTKGIDDEDVPLIRWDNYLYLYEFLYRDKIGEFFTATHEIGDPPPDTIQWEEFHMSRLPGEFDEFLEEYGKDGWIINLDLDYFFARQAGEFERIHSQEYISTIFRAIKRHLDTKNIACLTVCLSPECCGGWAMTEKLCYELCEELGIKFRLPA